MEWRTKALELLRSELKEAFTAREVVRLLSREKGFALGTTYRLIHDLVREGKLVRLGRGLYRFPKTFEVTLSEKLSVSDSISVTVIPDLVALAKKALETRGITFMITGPSLLYPFVHHFPRRMIHLVYVIKGGGETAREALKESNFRCLLKPTREEIGLAIEEFPEREIFVIRESFDLTGNKDGIAELERALVDTYFEATRRRIPFPPEEVGRIIANVFAIRKPNVSHLLLVAGRRGIKGEFRTLLQHLMPEVNLGSPRTTNEKVKAVLAGIGGQAR